jgi:hypothetical protein
MIDVVGADSFRVHFLNAPRPRVGLLSWFRPAPAVVDGWAIGQAVRAALRHCNVRTVRGSVQAWNEYRFFMAAADVDRLRPLRAVLDRDLADLLREIISDLGAETIGDVAVRLVAEEGGDVQPGEAILRVAFAADTAADAPGEITVRYAPKRPASAAPQTQRVGRARVRGPGGAVTLPDQERVVLGRAHDGASADHVALPGASGRVSRRHVALRYDGDALEVTREPGANPVRLAGHALEPGVAVRVPLPAQLVLGEDANVTVEPC